MAGVFALYALFLPMHRITDIIISLGVSILCYIGANRIFRGTIVEMPREITFEKSGNAAADAMLAQGREYIKKLDELSKAITDIGIVRQIVHLQEISIQIFDFIQRNPAQARKITTFMDYYYPTAIKFLDSYARYDTKSIRGDSVNETMAKISDSLSKIEEAFKHQLDNLYSDEALDITTDIAVLENIMKSEGVV